MSFIASDIDIDLKTISSLLPPPSQSWLSLLADPTLPEGVRDSFLSSLTVQELKSFNTEWKFAGRREQLNPPGDWYVWLILAGRDFGKTRAGAEYVIERHRNGCRLSALIGANPADIRDFMLYGPGGILKQSVKYNFVPRHIGTHRKLIWPDGAESLYFSAFDPEGLRGGGFEFAWADELAKWRYLQEAWDNLEMMIREGMDPRIIVTTTPKPRKLLRELLADAETVVTGGSTYDNIANIPTKTLRRWKRRYEGTETGRQELHAELLDESQGALWKRSWFDEHRILGGSPVLVRSATAVDPAASSTDQSDETGIIHGGLTADGRGIIDGDYSGRFTPDGWARRAIRSYVDHNDNYIIAEKNNGGEMVKYTIQATARDMFRKGEIKEHPDSITVKLVWASQGKEARAEPVSALYEQGRCSHAGQYGALEDQCCIWEPNSGNASPDRLDALVWLITDLMVKVEPQLPDDLAIEDLSRESSFAGAKAEHVQGLGGIVDVPL